MLMDSSYSMKDEIMSTITQNKKSILDKRSKITSEKLMKDAEDLMALQNTSSALLGEENLKLNHDFISLKHQKIEEQLDSASEFKEPAAIRHNNQPKLTSKYLQQIPEAPLRDLRDSMCINRDRSNFDRSSRQGSVRPWDSQSISKLSLRSVSAISSQCHSQRNLMNLNRIAQKNIQQQLQNLPKPSNKVDIDFEQIIRQL